LIIYAIVLFILMFRKRRAAIAHNVIFNALSVLVLVGWHFAGEKSNVGTFVDALPSIVSLWYFLVSKRVRATFTIC
jgi:4-hydroxybenzoate polyprenyltransferase